MAKLPYYFMSGKLFQKRPNWADFGLFKGKMANLACKTSFARYYFHLKENYV
jgi:hypothetical protein